MGTNQLTQEGIVNYLKSIQARDEFLSSGSFGYGPIWDIAMDKAPNYPLMWVEPITSTLRKDSLILRHNIHIVDLVNKNNSNRTQIVSDALKCCLDIKGFIFKDFFYDIFPSDESELEPLFEKYDDEVAGYKFLLELQVDWLADVCNIPGLTPSGATFNAGPGYFSVSLAGYLPLTGGVLTGPLTGTTSDFTTYYSGGTNLETIIASIASQSSGGTSASLWSASTGAGSIIANNGTGNVASGNFTLVGGYGNRATAPASSVLAGGYNIAGGGYSSIAGGANNRTIGPKSFIGGGTSNSATTTYAVIGGGSLNLASNIGTFIGSGINNKATGYYSVIGGGTLNQSTGYLSISLGGRSNKANGYYSIIGGGASNSAITIHTSVFGGKYNLSSGVYSSVGGGLHNISSGNFSSVINGSHNSATTIYSSIIGGRYNLSNAQNSLIGSGFQNLIRKQYSSIVGGSSNLIDGQYSFIGGGRYNLAGGYFSSVLGGFTNSATTNYSTVVGGKSNIASGNISFAGGGFYNSVTGTYSALVGGYRNSLLSNYSIIGGGGFNIISAAQYSSIFGGKGNIITLHGTYSSILGGRNNVIVNNDVFIVGSNITGTSLSNSIYTENARLAETPGTKIYSAGTPLEQIFLLSGSNDITRVQNGLNTYTGGTGNFPTVNVSALTISTLTASGTSNFTGALQSGSTDLSAVFIQGGGTATRIPVFDSSQHIVDSIMTQNSSALTVNGSVNILGDVYILGTASTFNTQTVQTKDNNILLNFSGSHVSAIGGGITVLSGNPNGGSSIWATDINGNWSANTGIIATALTINSGAIISGNTDLYSIFQLAGTGQITNIQPGTNTYTGGTFLNPSVNVSALTINTINASGSSVFNTLSANTFTAGTRVLIGTTNINTTNAETLLVNDSVSTTGFSNTIVASASTNNYAQINIYNSSSGTNSSVDVVATANNGNENINYIDMGINSSTFNGSIGVANDAYLYSTGNNLLIGNTTSNKNIQLFTDGITSAFTRVTINSASTNFNVPIQSASTNIDKIFLNTGVSFSIGCTFDGGGGVITTGQQGYISIPYNGIIKGWTIIADQSGTCVLDIWKSNNAIPTSANTITALAKPQLTSSQLSSSTAVNTWTTSLTPNDVIFYNVNSATGVTRVNLTVNLTKY